MCEKLELRGLRGGAIGDTTRVSPEITPLSHAEISVDIGYRKKPWCNSMNDAIESFPDPAVRETKAQQATLAV